TLPILGFPVNCGVGARSPVYSISDRTAASTDANPLPEPQPVTYITPAFRDRLKAAAARLKEPIAELTTRLTEVPAPTGDEGERAAVLAEVLRSSGFVD